MVGFLAQEASAIHATGFRRAYDGERQMTDVQYRFEVKFGSIVLSEPTGRVIPCEGGLTFDMTDSYELDQNGVEVPGSRKPGESGIIWYPGGLEPKRPWWRFWG